ncbi:hypothetical protein C2S51_000084 [Perilla frutescens var. frutescens]|nr:hypothetical protein C2S51_000084 [Perilla frutescens var. frutescens]
MITNSENAILDDSDYPSGIDSDGYSSDNEAPLCFMADKDEERVKARNPGLGYSKYTAAEKRKAVAQSCESGILKGFTRPAHSPQLGAQSKPSVQYRSANQPRSIARSKAHPRPNFQQRPSAHSRSSTQRRPEDHSRPFHQRRPSVQNMPSAAQQRATTSSRQVYPQRPAVYQPGSFSNPKRNMHMRLYYARQHKSISLKEFTSSDFATQYDEYLNSRDQSTVIPIITGLEKGHLTKAKRLKRKSILSKKKVKDTWYLDSGCSKHMTGDKEDLDGYKEVKVPLVTFRDNSKSQTIGEGFVVKGKFVVNGVSHVEGLKHKLLSISQLRNNGYSVDFSNSSCDIRDKSTGAILLTGTDKGKSVQRIRSDNGIEFLNQQMINFLSELGITHEHSAARTPQQNGIAERRNHTLKEAAGAIIVFGCKYYIHNNGKSQLKAFSAKADEGIFLGYNVPHSQAYRVFNKRTLIVEVTCHVVFDELTDEYKNKEKNCTSVQVLPSESLLDYVDHIVPEQFEASLEDGIETDSRPTEDNAVNEDTNCG